MTNSLDVFDIWAFVVGSIALSKTTNFTRKGAMATVGSVWLVYILIKMALAGLLSSFTG